MEKIHNAQHLGLMHENRLIYFGAEAPGSGAEQAQSSEEGDAQEMDMGELSKQAEERSKKVQQHMKEEEKERKSAEEILDQLVEPDQKQLDTAKPFIERARKAVKVLRQKVEQGQKIEPKDLRPLRDVMYEARLKSDDMGDEYIKVEEELGTIASVESIVMKGPDKKQYRLLLHDDYQGQDPDDNMGLYFMLVREDEPGIGTPVVKDGPGK